MPRYVDQAIGAAIGVVVAGGLGVIGNVLTNGSLIGWLGGAPAQEIASIQLNIAQLRESGVQGEKGEQGERGDRGPPGVAPEGAVVAFARECPVDEGWEVYAKGTGRVVIGAGTAYDLDYREWQRQIENGRTEGVALSGYELLARGGEEAHTLTIKEMPAHSHYIKEKRGVVVDLGHAPQRINNPGGSFGIGPNDTESEGGGQQHNNMPPYIALYFCIKES